MIKLSTSEMGGPQWAPSVGSDPRGTSATVGVGLRTHLGVWKAASAFGQDLKDWVSARVHRGDGFGAAFRLSPATRSTLVGAGLLLLGGCAGDQEGAELKTETYGVWTTPRILSLLDEHGELDPFGGDGARLCRTEGPKRVCIDTLVVQPPAFGPS